MSSFFFIRCAVSVNNEHTPSDGPTDNVSDVGFGFCMVEDRQSGQERLRWIKEAEQGRRSEVKEWADGAMDEAQSEL